MTGPGARLSLRLIFDSRLFDAATVARHLRHFESLLHGLVQGAANLREIPILSATERHQILVEWNDTAVGPPRELLHELS